MGHMGNDQSDWAYRWRIDRRAVKGYFQIIGEKVHVTQPLPGGLRLHLPFRNTLRCGFIGPLDLLHMVAICHLIYNGSMDTTTSTILRRDSSKATH